MLHILTIQGAFTRQQYPPAASPGNLLEVPISGPYCRPPESECGGGHKSV